MKKYLLKTIVAFIFLLIAGRGYAQVPNNYNDLTSTPTVGAPVTITPNHTRGTAATSFAINATPALLNGLAFNTTTGVISGTPTTVGGPTTYIITPRNASGNGDTFTVRITVGKGTITVNANNVNKPYGTTLSNGTSSTGFTATGLAPGATITTVFLTYNTGQNAGAPATANVNTYNNQIAASNAVGGGNFNQNNYNITYNTNKGDITVTPIALTITADNKTKIQGTANPTLTVTYNGFVNRDDNGDLNRQPNITTTAGTNSGAGNYTINVSNATADNYTITFVTGILTITPLPPNISYTTPVTLNAGITASLSPSSTGSAVVSYAMDPATPLPAGLTLNTSSGIISGTPTTVSGGSNYNVIGTNAVGTDNATIRITVNSASGVVYDWTGAANDTKWENPLNWDVNDVQQTINYPGSAGNTDIAQIGVNTDIGTFNSFPVLAAASNITIASLTFGNNNAPNGNTPGTQSLTVNGNLTATTVTQNHSSTGPNFSFFNFNPVTAIITTLQGSGSITCTNLIVGDNNTLPSNFLVNAITSFNIGGTLASTLVINVNGNFTINSKSGGIFGANLKNSDAQVSFSAGTLNIKGSLILGNSTPSDPNGNVAFTAFANFSVDLNTTNTPVLNLAGATPLNIATSNFVKNTLDFFNPLVAGHKPGTVNYTGTNQRVYNVAATGMNSFIDSDGETNGDGYVYDNLGFSGTGTKTLDAGAFNVAGSFTLSTTGTVVSLATNNPALTVGGDYSTATGSTFTNGTGAVTIGGNFTNGGTSTFGTPLVTFNSAVPVSLITTAPLTFNNVAFSNNGLKTLTTGDFSLANTGILTMADATTTLNVSATSTLTLISDANSSASVAIIPPRCKITGRVSVQRYLSALRGYRLLSSPVNSGTTTPTGIYSLNYVQKSMYLSGTDPAGGFDKVTTGPTLYLYKESFTGSNTAFTASTFRDITSITAGNSLTPQYSVDLEPSPVSLPVGGSFLVFFRGDRASAGLDAETVTTFAATTATLTTTGVLNQGQVTFKDVFTGLNTLSFANAIPTVTGFNPIGNPYASTIDLETIGTGIIATNISPFVYELNPANQVYEAYAVHNPAFSTGKATRYVASGQGFFVQATAAGQTVTINESAKVNGAATQNTGVNLFMGKPADLAAAPQYFRLRMMKDSINTTDAVVGFNPTAKTQFDPYEDAPFRSGPASMIFSSVTADNRHTLIYQLPLAQKGQTIRFNVGGLANTPYTLNVSAIEGIPAQYDVWLKDAYKKDSLDMRVGKSYSFSLVAADTGSYGAYRFSVVLRLNPAKAYKLISFDASKTPAKDVELVWVTQNEENYTHFTVERSTNNGKTYNVVGGVASTGAGTYTLTDKYPSNNNLYRLKQEDINDSIFYSNVVKIDFSNRGNDQYKNVNVYPNPARDRVTFAIQSKGQFYNSPKYKIEITNAWGLILQQTTSKDTEWQTNVGRFMPGTYYVRVINQKDGSLIGQNKFVKL